MQPRLQTVHQDAAGRCLLEGSCSVQLFPTQVCFFAAIFRVDVIQGRCLPQVCFSLTCPCRCLFHRFAPLQVCTMQVSTAQVFVFLRDSPSGSAPNGSASYRRVSTPRVSPHLYDLTDVPTIHAGVSFFFFFFCFSAFIGFGSRYRCARGAAPPLA